MKSLPIVLGFVAAGLAFRPLAIAQIDQPSNVGATAPSNLCEFYGKVVDRSENPVEGALVSIFDPATRKGLQAVTTNGSFCMRGGIKGDLVIEVNKDGFPVVLGAVRIKPNTPHRLNFLLADNTGEKGVQVKAGEPFGDQPAPENSPQPKSVKQAKLIHQVRPPYPSAARADGVDGTVRMSVTIRKDGTVDDLVVLSAPRPDLALAALLAVRQWRYTPTLLDGKPRKCRRQLM